VRVAPARGEFHPAVAHEIEHRRFLGKLHRMMHRQSIDGNAETKPLGPLRHCTEHDIRRREERELGLTMNLGEPVSVKSQAIGAFRLLQELLEPRRRRTPVRALNFGKETELHWALVEKTLREKKRERHQPNA
jgi:hypothetical protein